MSAQAAARRVQLVIASDEIDPDEMSSILGAVPDRETWKGRIPQGSTVRRPAVDNSWEIRESGDSDSDMTSLIGSLVNRLELITSGVRALRDRGCRVIVSLVIYASEDDQIGPGFFLDKDVLELIGIIGASFEVDFYFK